MPTLNAQVQAQRQQLLAEHGMLVLHAEAQQRLWLVTPSAKNPGHWQATCYVLGRGPVGDRQYDTVAAIFPPAPTPRDPAVSATVVPFDEADALVQRYNQVSTPPSDKDCWHSRVA